MIHRKCVECGKRIPNKRPENAITCSDKCAQSRSKKKHSEWNRRTRRSDARGPKYGGFVKVNVETITSWRSRAAPPKLRNDILEILSYRDPRILQDNNEAAFIVKAPDMKNSDEVRQLEER